MPAQHMAIWDMGKQASVLTQRHCPGAQKRAPASSSGCDPVHIGLPASHAQTGVDSQQAAAVADGKQASLFGQ
jgi:hypothetical protein